MESKSHMVSRNVDSSYCIGIISPDKIKVVYDQYTVLVVVGWCHKGFDVLISVIDVEFMTPTEMYILSPCSVRFELFLFKILFLIISFKMLFLGVCE